MINNQNSFSERVQNFLLSLSGVVPSVIEKCPTEQRRYANTGLAMLLIAFASGVAMALTVYLSTKNVQVAAAAGTFWFVLVLVVERVVQISIRKEKTTTWKTWAMAAPRLLLIVVLSLLVTHPIIDFLFHGEIELQMSKDAQRTIAEAKQIGEARFGAEITKLEEDSRQLETSLNNLKAEKDAKFNEAMAEGSGTGGTLKEGRGKFYAEKQAAYLKAEDEYLAAKTKIESEIEANKKRIRELRESVDAEVKDISKVQAVARGLLARSSALWTIITSDAGAAFIALLFIFGFILVDSVPLSSKLFSKRGPYDALLDAEEAARIADAEEEESTQKYITKETAKNRLERAKKEMKERDKMRDRAMKMAQDALFDETKPAMNADLAQIVEAHVKSLKDELLAEVKTPAASRTERPTLRRADDKPVSLEVRLNEPRQEKFLINFNLPETEIKGRDLLFSLRSVDEKFLPDSGNRPPLTEYQPVNHAGAEIEPDKKLFAQLGTHRIVNLVLPPVSDAEN